MPMQRSCRNDGVALLCSYGIIFKECMKYAYNQRNVRKRRKCMGISKQLGYLEAVCQYGYSPTVDHIIPVANGGHPSDMSNLQLIYLTCNLQKTDTIKPEAQFSLTILPCSYIRKVKL